MTLYTKRVIVVVTMGQLIASNANAKLVDTEGGEFSWTVGLSPSGNLPATHYWNNWQMKPDDYDQLRILLAEIPGNEQVFELSSVDPAIATPTPDEVLELTNPKLQRIETLL